MFVKIHLKTVFFLLFILLSTSKNLVSQSINWQLGNSVSTYQYTSTSGVSADYLKPGSGIHIALSLENVILDTVFLQRKVLLSSQKRILKRSNYFTANPKIAKILGLIHYEFGLSLNQFNSQGSTQNVAVIYQTNFAGIHGTFGPEFSLPKAFKFSIKGQVMLQKLFQGSQQASYQFMNLMDYDSFNQIQLFSGAQIQLTKKLNEKLSGYVAFYRQQTSHALKPGEGVLNFQPNTIVLGIKFLK